MALQLDYKIPDGPLPTDPDVQPTFIDYPECYVTIFQIRLVGDEAYILTTWYANKQAKLNGDEAIRVWEYQAPTSALQGDIYPAAYAYLLTLPDFAGAIEVP